MEPYWAQHLTWSAYFVFCIPASVLFWNEEQHEPLIVGIYLPFLSFRPWQWKGSKLILELERLLRKMWKSDEDAGRHILRKFWDQTRRVPFMSEVMASKVLNGVPKHEFSYIKTQKERGTSMEEESRRTKIFNR